ncbi:MAG: MaoC family dehydratase N-terminal domain-containing protein [Acidimicrobiales bacterium]|nr:MaoC family dehydratase N-terminal domain-containing protein [Acidimicrobiales bacterium]
MAMNLDLVGREGPARRRSWEPRDCTLYALCVGAGFDELAFVAEHATGHDQLVYPSFVCSGGRTVRSPDEAARPEALEEGILAYGDYQVHQVVHGEQELVIHSPVGPTGDVQSSSRVVGIYDKGSGAVVHVESATTHTASGDPAFSVSSKFFVMGEGGFGGDRGPSGPDAVPPDRAPDVSFTWQTLPQQSLLYRHGGNDPNRIHYDPTVAAAAGFEGPILMGLNTYGFACRGIVQTVCDGDPTALRSIGGRFASPGYNGDELSVRCWIGDDVGRTDEGHQVVLFDVVAARGATLLNRGRATVNG